MRGRARFSEGGSILILALWTLFFLAALALALGAKVSAELGVADRFRSETTAWAVARGGLATVCMEVAGDTNGWDGLDEVWAGEDRHHDVPLGEGEWTVRFEWETKPGRWETRYGVRGEESKININKAGVNVLQTLIILAGGMDVVSAGEVASAIWDWRDADDDALTAGAEASYYQGLNRPYACHNDPFDSIQELLLVKGMTAELFSKLRPYVTVFGAGKVNLNTADVTVMRVLAYAHGGSDPVACESLAAKIAAFRDGGGVFRDAESGSLVKQLGSAVGLSPGEEMVLSSVMGMVTLRATCFGGTACGRVKGRTDECQIDFVFDRERLELLSWHEY